MGDCDMCMRHNSNIHGHHWESGINSRTRTCLGPSELCATSRRGRAFLARQELCAGVYP